MKDMEKIDPTLSLKTEDIDALNKIFGNDLDTDFSTVNLDDLLSGDTLKSGIDTSQALNDLLDEIEDENMFLKVLKQSGVTKREEQLNFIENLNFDYESYRKTLKPGQKPTNEGFIRYLKNVQGWIDEDIVLLEKIMAGLDVNDEINMINDLEFAITLEEIIARMVDSLDKGDNEAANKAEREGRQLYHEHQMKLQIHSHKTQ